MTPVPSESETIALAINAMHRLLPLMIASDVS